MQDAIRIVNYYMIHYMQDAIGIINCYMIHYMQDAIKYGKMLLLLSPLLSNIIIISA